MPLPVTKGELNRLGDRLIQHDEPSEGDLVELGPVLAYYQDVLIAEATDEEGDE